MSPSISRGQQPPAEPEKTPPAPEGPGSKGYIQSLIARGLSPDKRMFDLLTVIDLARELMISWDPDRMLSLYLLTVMGRLGIGSGAVLLLDAAAREEFIVAVARGVPRDAYPELKIPVGSRLENRLTVGLRPLTASEAHLLLRVVDRARWKALEISIAVPMLVGETLQGITLLGKRMAQDPYGPDELEFLNYVANITILAVERSRTAHRHEEHAMELEVSRRLFERQMEELRRKAEESHPPRL